MKKKPASPKPFKCWFIYRGNKPYCGPYATKSAAENFIYPSHSPEETVRAVTILPRGKK